MPTTIYALCEPGTRSIRYIGKTINLKQRISAHLSQSVKEPNRLGRWLQKLASRNEKPEIRILCGVPDRWGAIVEIFNIRQARNAGIDLVNSTDGGDGCVNPTPEARAKVRASKLGSRNPNFGGVPAATLAAAGAANRLRVLTPEAREALRESKRGAKNPNFRVSASVTTRSRMSKTRRGFCRGPFQSLGRKPYFSDGGGI